MTLFTLFYTLTTFPMFKRQSSEPNLRSRTGYWNPFSEFKRDGDTEVNVSPLLLLLLRTKCPEDTLFLLYYIRLHETFDIFCVLTISKNSSRYLLFVEISFVNISKTCRLYKYSFTNA